MFLADRFHRCHRPTIHGFFLNFSAPKTFLLFDEVFHAVRYIISAV